MSNIKFYTNRQIALMMAIEARKVKYNGSIMDNAEDFYEWLQNAPMKDEDQKYWFDGSTKTTPKNGK